MISTATNEKTDPATKIINKPDNKSGNNKTSTMIDKIAINLLMFKVDLKNSLLFSSF